MPKFKIVKVHSFRIGNKRYAKGEIIKLSEEDAKRLKGANFLETAKEEKQDKDKNFKKKLNSTKFSLFLLLFLNVHSVI